MKNGQEAFYIPHLTVRIFPVIYEGPCERNAKCSRVILNGAGDSASNECLFETKKQALEELLKRAEHLAQEVRAGLDKLAEEETNNVGRLTGALRRTTMNFNADINLQDILTAPISAEQKAAILKEMLVFVDKRSDQYYFLKNLCETFRRIGDWEVMRMKEANR